MKWPVLVNILQSNRTNRTIYKENYYKELTHASMEDGKSQGLQCKLANQRPRRADGIVPIQKPVEPQEEPMFQSKSEGRKKS